MKDIFTQYIGELITGLIALVLGWLGKSRTQKTSDKADLTAKIQSVYKELIGDADASLDKMRDDIADLKKKQYDNEEAWKKKVQEIEKSWQTKHSRLQKKYNNLLKEFEDYKSSDK